MQRANAPTDLMGRLVRAGLALALSCSVLVGAPAPALAQTGQPSASIGQLHPLSGEVVAGRGLRLTAVLATSGSVAEASLVVDYIEREFRLLPTGGAGAVLVADLELAEGPHIARVEFTDDLGVTIHRSWRFSTSDAVVTRLSGSNRVATAVALSRDSFPDAGSASGAVLATARQFPDGLAAAPLAAQIDGPLLLSEADELSPETASELTRVVAPGSEVLLLGGLSALSADVEQAVADLGFDVVRVSGKDRAATAVAVARRLPDPTTAFVAAGHSFADGLAASAPAARDGSPILLTTAHELSSATRDHLAEGTVERVVIVGGHGAVSAEVEAEIATLVPTVERIRGADRYATAVAIVDAFYPQGTAQGVSFASGADFPDGLAGGPHAARSGMPLLLTRPGELPGLPRLRVTSGAPVETLLYGGVGAIGAAVEEQLRAAVLDREDGPTVVTRAPGAGSTVHALDTIELHLDRVVDVGRSTVAVTVAGHEVGGSVRQGDFAEELVLQLGDLPALAAGVNHLVTVRVQALAGPTWGHDQWRFTYRKIDLGRGDAGAEVDKLQQRLTDLGYWLGDLDGQFGTLTTQAVMAFQKYEGLERSGIADDVTRARLEVADRPRPVAARKGRWVEIDKTRQVMLFVVDGEVRWTFNTSTGTETEYTRPDGSKGFAHTPEGWFTFFRQIDGLREADLGQLWRPKYFTNAGHAIHGSRSIPAHPASHGCARLSYPAIDFIWSAGLAPIGTPLLVHR